MLDVAGDGACLRYSVVIITNQALKSNALAEWKRKIPLIGNAVGRLRPTTVQYAEKIHGSVGSSPTSRSGSSPPPRETASASQCQACGTSWNAYSLQTVCR